MKLYIASLAAILISCAVVAAENAETAVQIQDEDQQSCVQKILTQCVSKCSEAGMADCQSVCHENAVNECRDSGE